MNVRLLQHELNDDPSDEHQRVAVPAPGRVKVICSSYLVSMKQAARLHREANAITGVTLAIAVVLTLVYVNERALLLLPVGAAGIFFSVISIYATVATIRNLILMIFRIRPRSPIRYLIGAAKASMADRERASSLVYVAALFSVFAVAFSCNKALISRINPFSWDERFAQLDAVLFLGNHPHEYLGWIFSYPSSAMFVEVTYQAWFYAVYLSIVIAGYHLANTRQARIYMLASVLCWFVGGNVLALAFSSAGPIFQDIHGMDVYDDHHTKILAAVPVIGSFSDSVRDTLLLAYQSHGVSSISAFPSMHVGSTLLLVLFAWRGGLVVRLSLVLFLGVIVVGSVALLWHYAVDSLAGLIIGVLSWLLAAWVIDRTDRVRLRRTIGHSMGLVVHPE